MQMPSFEEVFREAEAVAFRCLTSGRGFRQSSLSVSDGHTQMSVFGQVCYSDAKGHRQVTVSLAPLRLELDLTISLVGGGTSYTLGELNRLENGPPIPPPTHDLYQAMHDSAQLAREFGRLAEALESCGHRFFADDHALWQDLAEQRQLLLRASESARAIQASEAAFQAKDWSQVVELLRPLSSQLSKVAAARLAYAMKRVSD